MNSETQTGFKNIDNETNHYKNRIASKDLLASNRKNFTDSETPRSSSSTRRSSLFNHLWYNQNENHKSHRSNTSITSISSTRVRNDVNKSTH